MVEVTIGQDMTAVPSINSMQMMGHTGKHRGCMAEGPVDLAVYHAIIPQ